MLDLVGGPALEDAPRQVRQPARIVSIVDPATVLGLGGKYVFVRPDPVSLDASTELFESGKMRVDVSETVTLDQIAEAHRLSEGHTRRGKSAVSI